MFGVVKTEQTEITSFNWIAVGVAYESHTSITLLSKLKWEMKLFQANLEPSWIPNLSSPNLSADHFTAWSSEKKKTHLIV